VSELLIPSHPQAVGDIFAKALLRHPRVEWIWVRAAEYEFVRNASAFNARILFQRALRVLPKSRKLLSTYFRMEWLYLSKLLARQRLETTVPENGQASRSRDEASAVVTGLSEPQPPSRGPTSGSQSKDRGFAPAGSSLVEGSVPIAIVEHARQRREDHGMDGLLDLLKVCEEFMPLSSHCASKICESLLKDFPERLESYDAVLEFIGRASSSRQTLLALDGFLRMPGLQERWKAHFLQRKAVRLRIAIAEGLPQRELLHGLRETLEQVREHHAMSPEMAFLLFELGCVGLNVDLGPRAGEIGLLREIQALSEGLRASPMNAPIHALLTRLIFATVVTDRALPADMEAGGEAAEHACASFLKKSKLKSGAVSGLELQSASSVRTRELQRGVLLLLVTALESMDATEVQWGSPAFALLEMGLTIVLSLPGRGIARRGRRASSEHNVTAARTSWAKTRALLGHIANSLPGARRAMVAPPSDILKLFPD